MTTVSYTRLPAFEDHFQPKTVNEAVSLLAKYGKDAKLLAGGTDLLVLMRDRTLTPNYIIDISKIPGLDYIRSEKHTLAIGALATLRAVELSPAVRNEYPLLHEAAHHVGSVQVRTMGTMVGNICRASPAADTPPPLLALEASLVIANSMGTRIVPLDQFFTGPGETLLMPNEMVTEVSVPRPRPGSGTSFLKVTRVAVDLAKVNAASVLTVRNGICENVRIALGGVAPTPIRARKAEAILKGNRLENKIINEAADIAAAEMKPITDIRSTGTYRREVGKVLVQRVLEEALERANKG